MIHHSFKTLISIILMGASLGGYSQSINTTFIKSTQERSSYNQAQESVSKSDSLVELTDEVKTNSRLKAHTTSVTINDSETWDEWQTLGTADMTTSNAYSDFHKEVTVYKRYSTVSGHEKIFQIKIPGILDGYDAILWGEENDRQPEVILKNEYVEYEHSYNGYDMVAIGCTDIFYNKALGNISIGNVWHFPDYKYLSGYPIYANYIIQLRDMPEYSDTLLKTITETEYYSATVNQAIINFTHTDNIAEIRYKVTAIGYPGPDFYPFAPDVDYDNDEGVVVLGKDENSITVNLEGRQLYILTYMCYTADGVAIYSRARYFWSMQEDGKQWQSLGTTKFADKTLQWHYVSGDNLGRYWVFQEEEYNNLKLVEWDVELQQCVDEPTLYRLVNPYAKFPYIGQQIELVDYTQDESGNYIKNAYATYTPQYDNSQNYYLYFYSNNGLRSNKSSLYTQYYSISGIKYSTNGDTFDDYRFNATYRFREDNYIDFSDNESIYVKLPGYIDYKFTSDYDNENDIITVTIADPEHNTDVRYKIAAKDGSFSSEEKSVAANGKIDLNEEGLTNGVAYTIRIASYSSDNEAKNSAEISLTYGFTDWAYVGTAAFTTKAINGADGTGIVYKRHEKSNSNHEQYRFDYGILYPNESPIFDVADLSNKISNGNTPVTVQSTATAIDNLYMTDAYSYTNNDNYKEYSYFNAARGIFSIYACYYYKDGRFAAAAYDTYSLAGYPDLSVGTTENTDEQTTQVTVDCTNCSYVKYGTYDRTDYTLEESFEALRADKNANRITQKTTLSFSNPGCYYFVAIAYDSNDKELLNESAAISIAEPFDMTQWTKIGTSKVVDGWVLGYALGFDESEYMQEVETYVKNDNNNVIGLYQPFKNEIYKDLQIPDSAEPLMITIDARDKDFIMIVPHNTHCGISNISIANAEGYFYWQGRSKEYTTKLLSAEDMTRIDDNNTITIPKSIAIIDGSAEYANPIYITLPADYKYSAVSNISVDNTDAPVEYYNLNGVRISSDNLVPGLYIRRQGNNVSKIAVK